MTYTSSSMFTVPLTSKAYKLAKSFQSQYENPVKAQQVYLNTLAVYAVDSYCQCLGIETDLEASESLNSVLQPLMNIADLEIEGIGKLECRPVLPEDKFCDIPAETWENRIGYIAVEINDSSREATLLGFYPPINALEMMERFSLDDFKPLEAFLDHLDRLESAQDFLHSYDEVAIKVRERLNAEPLSEIVAQIERIVRTCKRDNWRYAGGDFLANYVNSEQGIAFRSAPSRSERDESNRSQNSDLQELAEDLLEKLSEIWGIQKEEENSVWIDLSEWFQNSESLLRYNFKTLESFLLEQQESLVFRFATTPRSRNAATEDSIANITGVQKIQLQEHALALAVCLQLGTDHKTDVLLRLYPAGDNTCLPSGLQLIVIDSESGEMFLEAQARSADNWIQLQFRGEPGERFSVKLALGDLSVTNNFVI